MAEYMITRASIINRCNSDGKEHFLFTEKERPCREAFLKDVKDNEVVTGNFAIPHKQFIENLKKI